MKPHWYRNQYYFCPICGGGEHFRERVYLKEGEVAPERYSHLRHIQHDAYNGCVD